MMFFILPRTPAGEYNTSEVKPTAITGDMHSINKANFAILHWFGLRFEPHFTDLNKQLKELYCTRELSAYKKCLVQPVGQIDQDLIIREKSNLDRIVATLGLKEMTQGTLMRKLCTYTTTNPRTGQPDGCKLKNTTVCQARSCHTLSEICMIWLHIFLRTFLHDDP